MKYTWTLFWTAMMFFTRIPCPKVDYSEEILSDSARFFPVIGLIIGGMNFLVFYLFTYLFPREISVLISMIFSFLLTGGFHEDGLADSCDAFGGGYTKEKVLEIMKDSRIGSFGALGLIIALLLKFQLLVKMDESYLLPAFILGHSMSRILPIWVMKLLPYVQFDGKSKPIAKEPTQTTFWVSQLFALFIFLPFALKSFLLISILSPLLLFFPIVISYLKKRIGGYTGDTLGAVQQISEILLYMGLFVCGSF